jgi:hypothetical protein
VRRYVRIITTEKTIEEENKVNRFSGTVSVAVENLITVQTTACCNLTESSFCVTITFLLCLTSYKCNTEFVFYDLT